MSNTPLKHIVFVPAPSWGHLRPAVTTAIRLVEKFQDLTISLFVHDPEVPKVTKYLNSQSSTCSGRVKVVTSSGNEGTATVSPPNPAETILNLEKNFKSWITQELQQTMPTQIDGRSIEKPSGIIEDLFNGGVTLASKDIHNLPVTSWWTTTAAALISQQGDQEHGHGGKIFESIAQKGDISPTEVGEVYLQEISNRLICIPGTPVRHEWELATQHFPYMLPVMVRLLGRRESMVKQVDRIVCCTTSEMEPISAAALSNALGKPLTPFFIGPAVDPVVKRKSDPNSPVTQFLDRAYSEKGAHSVVYIASGPALPPLPGPMSHLTTILDEISTHGYKFIFALPATKATQLDQSWIDAHVQAGNAIFPEWTDQTAVLEHPTIHYFMSHGGWSSVTEALVRGVPMIFWPFVSDQPSNTLQIATTHNCGFELLQVRTGPAKSTAYQDGREVEIVGTDDSVRGEIKRILGLSKGPMGILQRKNAGLLGKVIADSLAPGGSGDVALEKLGEALGIV